MQSKISILRRSPAVAGHIEGERPPLIKEGKYQLKFEDHETALVFGRSKKLVLHFTVLDYGDYFQTPLCRYYNVRGFIGKPGRGGRFRVGWHSDVVREFAMIIGLPRRLDRISFEPFRNLVIRGEVRTVLTNSRQQRLSDGVQYSVIGSLLGVHNP